MEKLNKIIDTLKEHKELSLVLLILCVLGMIIVPIPHQLMDVLIALNMSFTVIILMVVLYMKTPIEITSFPSILLVLALFRIGLTISSSRLILLDGNAGDIITTFGEFVVGGNIVVGIIMFSVITMINFIVITKGAERVAEVSARFSLDAMPGKQMSIDSDLRANNIDMVEAQRRRNALGLESKLYGSMDGAMKFVKGDAIASILDILINLIGGLIVGVSQHGLSFSQALQTYTILTVGDGLVQQVPAIIISMTAGLMITRVSDDGNPEKENLGRNILNQVFNSHKTLFSASVLLVFLALIPGMPHEVFAVIFVILISIGFYIKNASKKTAATSNDLVEETDQDAKLNNDASWKMQPIVLNISIDLKDATFTKMIKNILVESRQNLLLTLGVEVPQIIIRYSPQLALKTYQLMIFEIPVATSHVYLEHILILDDAESVYTALNVTNSFKGVIDLGLKTRGTWVSQKHEAQCKEFGLSFLSIDKYMSMHLSKTLTKHVSEFMGMQEVKNLLDKASEYQELIKELLRMIPLNKITEVLQRLVAENISIRNFKKILDSMLEWCQREKEVVIITEYVRQALGRYIAHQYSNGTYIITCFFVDGDIEDMIRDAIRFNDKGSFLSIDPDITNAIIEKIREGLDENSELEVPPVLITQMDVRRYLRSIIENDFPNMPVLSFQEVEAYVKLNSLGVIEL